MSLPDQKYSKLRCTSLHQLHCQPCEMSSNAHWHAVHYEATPDSGIPGGAQRKWSHYVMQPRPEATLPVRRKQSVEPQSNRSNLLVQYSCNLSLRDHQCQAVNSDTLPVDDWAVVDRDLRRDHGSCLSWKLHSNEPSLEKNSP